MRPTSTSTAAGLTIAAALAVAAPAAPAFADTITAQSKVVAVTVFPSGAEVTREVQLTIPAGDHTVDFDDLPVDVITTSLRLEGSATGAIELGPIDVRQLELTSGETDALDAERKRLEDAIRAADRAIQRVGFEIQAKETERDYLANLARLPSAGPLPPAAVGGAGPEQWAAVLGIIASNMSGVQGALFDLGIQRDDLEEQKRDLETELERLAPVPRMITRGSARLAAETDVEATLTLRYQVRNASWRPIYDVRLATSSGADAKSEVTIARRAAVQQSTGESWTDVALKLSTARPSGRLTAPDVASLTVDFRPDPPVAPTAVGRAPTAEMMPAPVADAVPLAAARTRSAMMAPAKIAASEQTAEADVGSFQVTFAIRDRTSVTNDGVVKSVLIGTDAIDADLFIRTSPRLDARAYAYADVTLPAGAPLLAGEAHVFREGTYVGRQRWPQLAAGQGYQIGFGQDDAVTVEFSVGDETRGATGIITASKTDQRTFKIVLTNLRETPIRYEVLDRLPISLNEAIKVTEVRGTQPSRRDIDDKRGVVAWDGSLRAGEKREITFGYQIVWPNARDIVYRDRE
ncbi:MAG: mucoidy inhibitor MuiA family protein [Hyphomicrobiaceae bacterium]